MVAMEKYVLGADFEEQRLEVVWTDLDICFARLKSHLNGARLEAERCRGMHRELSKSLGYEDNRTFEEIERALREALRLLEEE